MAAKVVNSAQISNYFNEIIEESFNCGAHLFSKTEYDADAPEFYFQQCWLSMGMAMAKRTKLLFENVQKKECEKCVVMANKLEKMNSKMAGVTKRYNLLISFVSTLDPTRTKTFLESEQTTIPCSPKRGDTPVRIPLSPIQSSAGNIRNGDNVGKYFSPKKLPRSSELENYTHIVGSPNHCSTQIGLKYDENIKIKNSRTPTKKKKEISPFKPAVNNIFVTQPMEHKFGTHLNYESHDDSIECFPETPPENLVGLKHNLKSEVKKIVPIILPKDEVEEFDGDDNALSPVIPRTSEAMMEALKLSNSKTPEQTDKYDEIGVSPSIMSDRIPARNLMYDSFGLDTLEPESSSRYHPHHSRISPQFSPTEQDITTAPSHKVDNSRKGKKKSDWVTTDAKKVSKSSSSFLNFKPPPSKGTKLKQMTLPQMKKKATENVKVDISKLDEYDGGTRPFQNSLKRKSDEKDEIENTPDAANKNYGRSKHNSEEEPLFDEFKYQDVPKQTSSRVYKREKKDLNTTAQLIIDLDRLPNNQSQEPAFAYKPERAIRKKEERAKLTGWDCDDCRKYYEAMGIDKDPTFVQQLKNQCSKHRAKYPVNIHGTPPGFWETDFPSTLEMKRTGAFRTDTDVDFDDEDEN